MKCYCSSILELEEFPYGHYFVCKNNNCEYFDESIIFIENWVGTVLILLKKEENILHILTYSQNILLDKKNNHIMIDYHMMQELLKFNDLNQIKECYENYALFI